MRLQLETSLKLRVSYTNIIYNLGKGKCLEKCDKINNKKLFLGALYILRFKVGKIGFKFNTYAKSIECECKIYQLIAFDMFVMKGIYLFYLDIYFLSS